MRPAPSLAAPLLGLALAALPAAQESEAPPDPALTVHRAPSALDPAAVTTDWPQFLGPGGQNVSPETRLRRDWGAEGPPLVWEVEKGTGYAAPAIQGEHLVHTYRTGDREIVECRHPETGALHWRHSIPSDYRDRYGYSKGPRATPRIDGERVYTYGVQGVLQCLELATGKVLWKRDLTGEYEVEQDFFGVVPSPVLFGELLIVYVGSPGGPSVIALDRRTGETRWEAKDDWPAGYSTPVIGTVAGRERCFVFTGGDSKPPKGGLLILDPATGEVGSRHPWRSRTYESVNASSPVLIGDRVFVSATYDTGGTLLDVEPDGSMEVVWTSDVLSTHFNTPIHEDGHLYGFDGRNEPDASLVCQEVATGEEVWREVLEWEETYELNGSVKPRPMSVYRGSLLSIDGDYLCQGESGHLLWLDLSPEGCRVLARAWLFAAHETWTPLVVSRGLLYVSQNTRDFVTGSPPRLLCYDLRRPAD